jgi:hypothetical protein
MEIVNSVDGMPARSVCTCVLCPHNSLTMQTGRSKEQRRGLIRLLRQSLLEDESALSQPYYRHADA